jgi:hypothetical protein
MGGNQQDIVKGERFLNDTHDLLSFIFQRRDYTCLAHGGKPAG